MENRCCSQTIRVCCRLGHPVSIQAKIEPRNDSASPCMGHGAGRGRLGAAVAEGFLSSYHTSVSFFCPECVLIGPTVNRRSTDSQPQHNSSVKPKMARFSCNIYYIIYIIYNIQFKAPFCIFFTLFCIFLLKNLLN